MVVYGHTPVPQPDWLNRTINIDTGCVFGGNLTALRYPEKELVSVIARATYARPAKPLVLPAETAASLTSQQAHDDLLDIDDVIGKRIVTTRLHHNVTVREENALAALEVMSRFAANPKWLIYLPPTMSPTETSTRPGLLEHPAEAFSYFRGEGIARVICEEKHMGSRAVVIVCRDEDTARRRFGIVGEGFGICYTRTGRRFFDNAKIEQEFLQSVQGAVDAAGFWEQFHTDWICLGAELMPWSAKAQELLGPLCGSWLGRQSVAHCSSLRPGVAGIEEFGRTAPARIQQAPLGSGKTVCRFLPSLLLAGALRQRPEVSPVSPSCHRRPSPCTARSRVAHGEVRGDLQSRRRPTAGHSIQNRGCDRHFECGRGDSLVGRTDRAWRRRYGRQAAEFHRERTQGLDPARSKMPGP
jgi:PNKP adenylyltransferase domain, ligase domain